MVSYILYGVSFFSLVFVTVIYLFRSRLSFSSLPLPQLPQFELPFQLPSLPRGLYTRLPTSASSFASDIESGLSSSTFDLAANNLAVDDPRAGLDGKGKKQIQKIMKNRGVGFDEARRVWMQIRFREEGIGEDGRPRDPKFVSFS